MKDTCKKIKTGNCFKNIKLHGNSPHVNMLGTGEETNCNGNGNTGRMEILQPSSTLNWLVLYSASCPSTVSKVTLFPYLVLYLPMEVAGRGEIVEQ